MKEITDYAMGELKGPAREALEKALAASESLQRELTVTQDMIKELEKLPSPSETLTEEQRAAIKAQGRRNRIARRRVTWLVVGGSLAAAACILFALSLPAISSAKKIASVKSPAPLPVGISKTEIAAAAATPAPLLADAMKRTDDLRTEIVDKAEAVGQAAQLNMAQAELQAAPMPQERAMAMQNLQQAVAAPSAPVASTASASATGVQAGGAILNGDLPLRGRLFAAAQSARPVELNKAMAELEKAGEFNTEAYDSIQENVFLEAQMNPLSTFSIDVDTASYSNVRRFLQDEQMPPAGAIRTEELINYFTYAYPQPDKGVPFSVNLEAAQAPWDTKRILVRIGLKGRELPPAERGPANLVFLADVSGSMDEPNKLPLLKRSLQALVENLSPKDRVAIVVYAGSSGLVLPSTAGTEKQKILEALGNLSAGGSTNGGEGIRLAYKLARENFMKEGNNRVILCTDGDFNVGTTNESELVKLIEKERASGVFLSVLGFGTGNLKDATMEKLADKGNGNYGYIDSFSEGRKILVEQMGATLFTIAKDVKIQVEFNPARVAGYRLIGYENRLLAKEDFNDDKKDAGEIGAGHTVTALYEVIPAGAALPDRPSVDPLRYQPGSPRTTTATSASSEELLTVKLRYKAPDGDVSKLIEVPFALPAVPEFAKASVDFQFAAAVAGFAMKLRGSPDAGDLSWSEIQAIARRSLGADPGSYRAEFLTLVEKASRLPSRGE